MKRLKILATTLGVVATTSLLWHSQARADAIDHYQPAYFHKAEQALDAIRNMLSHQAAVRRDGVTVHLNADQLVPGDVVLLEQGDIEEGLNAASAIGDDRLQRQSRGYVSPESFTHGSSAQRVRWFKVGLEQGTLSACNTFATDDL